MIKRIEKATAIIQKGKYRILSNVQRDRLLQEISRIKKDSRNYIVSGFCFGFVYSLKRFTNGFTSKELCAIIDLAYGEK